MAHKYWGKSFSLTRVITKSKGIFWFYLCLLLSGNIKSNIDKRNRCRLYMQLPFSVSVLGYMTSFSRQITSFSLFICFLFEFFVCLCFSLSFSFFLYSIRLEENRSFCLIYKALLFSYQIVKFQSFQERDLKKHPPKHFFFSFFFFYLFAYLFIYEKGGFFFLLVVIVRWKKKSFNRLRENVW